MNTSNTHEADQGLATDAAGALTIAAVERETGLSKDTLRMWERRYGFPRPLRDARDERLYPAEQVQRLRLIAWLLRAGQRPGRIVTQPLQRLQELAQSGSAVAAAATAPDAADEALQDYLDALRRHDATRLRLGLNQAVLRLGLARFVTEVVAPLNRWVGEAWLRGEIQVFTEHLYTECVVAVLRAALGGSTLPRAHMPRVLLTTLPDEPHVLGLLMAEVMLALEGCTCISLGAQTPLADIVQASAAHRIDIVGLSFSPALPAAAVLGGLKALRAQLPAAVPIWAGGSHPALARRLPAGVTRVARLQDIAALLAPWRERARA